MNKATPPMNPGSNATSTATLAALLEHAEAERDAARARAQQADDAVRRARAQAEQLHGYREDYRRRAPALNGRSASIELLRCHQGFTQRLDQALAQQLEQLSRVEQHALALREALLDSERRVAAVSKLVERRALELQHHQRRAEQRHSDEAALRLASLSASSFGALSRKH